MVDIDDFGAFNARFGPQAANHLLKKLGAFSARASRRTISSFA